MLHCWVLLCAPLSHDEAHLDTSRDEKIPLPRLLSLASCCAAQQGTGLYLAKPRVVAYGKAEGLQLRID